VNSPQRGIDWFETNKVWFACLLLGLATIVLFLPASRFDFINYDDLDYVTENPHVQAGLTSQSIQWAFTAAHASNWHPATWLSHMLDTELFGHGPSGPHAVNILFHAINSLLLFVFLYQITNGYWRSLFVAALFALHPLHVESVAWISERKDVLSTFFGFLTLMAYRRHVKQSNAQPSKSKVFYILALFLFACSLMSKPMLVTLPFILLLLDYWPLKRLSVSPIRLILEKIPFLALSTASCIITLRAQEKAVQSLDHLSLGIRGINAINSYAKYLAKTVWPVDLAIPYPHTGVGNLPLFCGALLLMLAILVCISVLRKKLPFLVTGWFWYFGTLVPVIGLVQVGMQSMADRYTYLPLIGVFVVIAWSAHELMLRMRWSRQIMAVCGVMILVPCAARTYNQLKHWKNSEALFRHAISVTKGNDLAHYNLASYLYEHGRVEEAIEHYRQAIRIRPSYNDAMNNLGVALASTGKLEEAATLIQEAIQRQPLKADSHYNLGNVLVMQKKFHEAAEAYRDAVRLKSDYPEAHNNLGNVELALGNRASAMKHFREALRLNPHHEKAREQLRKLESANSQ
jgi:Tfp pilus assembly protein PilF